MNNIITTNDIDEFTVGIENGYLNWKLKLKNDKTIYQILYKIEKHITPTGNKSKKKIYFIRKEDKKLIFDNEVKKMFSAFKRPYIISGI